MTANLPVPYEQYNAPKPGGPNKIAIIVAILVTAVVVGAAMFFWGPVAPTKLTSATTTAPTATESVTVTVTASPSANVVIAPTPDPTPIATTALPTETTPTDMPVGQSEYLADLDIDRGGGNYGVDPLAINGQIFVKASASASGTPATPASPNTPSTAKPNAWKPPSASTTPSAPTRSSSSPSPATAANSCANA